LVEALLAQHCLPARPPPAAMAQLVQFVLPSLHVPSQQSMATSQSPKKFEVADARHLSEPGAEKPVQSSLDARQMWISFAVGAFIIVEAHQHLFCTANAESHTDIDVLRSCAVMTPVHTFTELLCNYAIVVFVVKAMAGFCGAVSARRIHCTSRTLLSAFVCLMPALAYVLWPRTFRGLFGEEGSCGRPCLYIEEFVEHACCIDVLMSVAGAMYDFVCLWGTGGAGALQHCWASSLALERDLEEQLFSHEGQQDEHSADVVAMRALAKRVAVVVGLCLYLLAAGLFAESTLGGWQHDPEQEMLFRVVDTACQAGHVFRLVLALRLLLHWLELCRGGRLAADLPPFVPQFLCVRVAAFLDVVLTQATKLVMTRRAR